MMREALRFPLFPRCEELISGNYYIFRVFGLDL